MKRCKGCGALIQIEGPQEIGYASTLEKELCNRCFRIQHYGEYKKVSFSSNTYIDLLKQIDKKRNLLILVIDLFMIPKELFSFFNDIKSPILLVLNKRDILPLSINDRTFKNYILDMPFKAVDTVIVSSKKNYGFDILYEKINMYAQKRAYIVGFTSAGKSTMIKKLLYHYANVEPNLTTSLLPSTTLDMIEIRLNDQVMLIDTPGLIVSKSMINVVEESMLKKIMPKIEIKPRTFQMRQKQYLEIENLAIIEAENINLTLYISNSVQIRRVYKRRKQMPFAVQVHVKKGEDLVIEGLLFAHIHKNATLKISMLYDVEVYTRKSLFRKD